jgi:fumarylpyruvate hydrolase
MSADLSFPALAAPTVPIASTGKSYPVRRIHCVGRNYAAHIREMGFDPDREPPFFFAKPADAIVPNGATIGYPLATTNFAYEIELVVAIGKRGVNIPREAALDHVFGYAVGLDMTRRDLQLAARDRGRPWEPGKAFDESAPITAIHPASRVGHPEAGRIWLKVNGETKQDADLRQLVWPVPDIVAYLSRLYELQPGDLIYTGTPEGVGPVQRGDEMRGGVEGLDELTIRVAA